MIAGTGRNMNLLRRPRTCGWILAITAALLTGGCLDYEEEMWLNKDLSGTAAFTVSVTEQLVKGNTGLERDMNEEKVRRDLERIPGVKVDSFKTFRDAGRIIAKVHITFDSLEKLTRHESSLSDASPVSFLGKITVYEGGGKVRFERQLPVIPQTRGSGFAQDLLVDGLGSLLLSKNFLSYKLHVPADLITANTQRIDGAQRTVEWKYTLAQAVREPPSMHVEWKAAGTAVRAAAVIIILLVVGVIGWLVVRAGIARRRSAAVKAG